MILPRCEVELAPLGTRLETRKSCKESWDGLLGWERMPFWTKMDNLVDEQNRENPHWYDLANSMDREHLLLCFHSADFN